MEGGKIRREKKEETTSLKGLEANAKFFFALSTICNVIATKQIFFCLDMPDKDWTFFILLISLSSV